MSKATINSENRNIKVGVILSLLSFVVSMVVNVFFIRYINKPSIAGQSQYGLYTFSTSITSLLLALSFGMNSSYIRFATIAKKENGENGLKTINGSFAVLFSVAAVAAAIIGSILVAVFNKNLKDTTYTDSERLIIISCLSVSVVNVVVSLISNIFTLYTNYNMRFIWARVMTITISVMTPLITSIIIYFNHSIVTYVCVELFVNLTALIINIIFCVKSLKYKVKISFKRKDFHILKNILVFSLFIFFVTIVTELTSSTPKILLGLFPNKSGDSEISVAYYQLAATFIGSIAVASSAVSSTYIPLVNRYVAYGTNDDVNELFIRSTKKMIVAYAFVMGGFFACGREFVSVWQGDNGYDNTNLIYYVACLLSLISFVPSTFGVASEVQRAMNKHQFRSYALLIGFVVNALTSLILLLLIPHFIEETDPDYYSYQVVACSIGFASGNVTNIVTMSIYNHRTIKLNMIKYYKIIIFYLIVIAGSYGIVELTFKALSIEMSQLLTMLLKGGAYICVFLILLYLFDNKFFNSVLHRENTEVMQPKPVSYHIEQFDRNKTCLVFRDFDIVLNSLKAKKNLPIFEHPTMKKLRELHEKYNVAFVITINKRTKYRLLTKKVGKDLARESDWLSFAFSSGRHNPYSFVDAPFISNDLSRFYHKFVKKMHLRIQDVLLPDFSFDKNQLDYVKSFYDCHIKAVAIFDDFLGEDRFAIKTENNFLYLSCAHYSKSNGGICYFNSSDADSLEAFIQVHNIVEIESIFDDIYVNKDYPQFYKKKIAVINTYNNLSTGRIAKHIMSIGEKVGLKTKLFYGRLEDESDANSYYFGSGKLWNLLNNIYVKISGRIGHAHYFETKRLIKKLKEFNPDVIHLHNIHGNCLNYPLLFNYLSDKKVVVTMHDCFWMTGRCAHFTYSSIQCDKWKDSCKKCPHLDFYMRSYFFDYAHKLFVEKREFIEKNKTLWLICLSNWQKNYFLESGIDASKIRLISNGIEIQDVEHNTINSQKTRIIFVSSYLTTDKGVKEINKLANILSPSRYEICVVGMKLNTTFLSENIHYLGRLNNEKTIKAIADSDVFVYPTHADTLPTVLIESLMVGTPVISYDVGGCKEIIGDNGETIKFGDFNGLLSAIYHFDKRKYDRGIIKQDAKLRFNIEDMDHKYLKLYSEVLGHE